jgi:general secretion pathway protein E
MVIDQAIRHKVQAYAPAAEIKDVAIAAGMRTLRDDAARWIAEGRTSLAEVMRVTRQG